MGLKLLFYSILCIILFELTLFVCVWWWSCNSLHGSRCWCKWTRGYLAPKRGQHGEFFMNLLLWIFLYIL